MSKPDSSKSHSTASGPPAHESGSDAQGPYSLVRRHFDLFLFAVVTIGVYLTRLPVVKFGPGRDPDAWRLLDAGISIAETGRYTMSRPPGFPVPEFIYSLYTVNPMPLLHTAALVGAAGVAFFALTARALGCKDYLLAAVAVALTPVVLVNGASVMDYTWAFAFTMAAFYLPVTRRPLVAGILLGLAAGSRITSAAMLIPFTVLLLFDRRPIDARAIRQSAKLWISCGVVAVLCYLPVVFTYGRDALRFVDDPRTMQQILQKVGMEFWGSLGLVAVTIALGANIVFWFVKTPPKTSIPESTPEYHTWSWVSVLVIYAAAFLRLPHEPGYLILTVPFVVLLFARYAFRPVFIVFCALLVLSPAVHVTRSGIGVGPARINRGARGFYLEESELIMTAAEQTRTKSVVVAGWLAPQLRVMWYYRYGGESDFVVFEKELSDSAMTAYVETGRAVYLLPRTTYYHEFGGPNRLLQSGAQMLYYRGPPTIPGGDERPEPAPGGPPGGGD